MKEVASGLKLTKSQVFALKQSIVCANLVMFWLNKVAKEWQKD